MEHISDIIKDVKSLTEYPISTGYKFLDTMIGGHYPGEMTTICGEEDSGKSAYVISQLNHIAVEQKIATLLIINNMSKRSLVSCMTAYYCNLEAYNINSVLDDEQHMTAVKNYLQKLKEAPLFVMSEWCFNEGELLEEIESVIQIHRIKIAFFDESNGSWEYSAKKRVNVNCLKTLSLKMNIPVVATTCIWNEREGMEGMRPFLQDLYFCSEIHGHDTVIGLIKYERHYVFQDENGRDLRDTIHLEILKKRGTIVKRRFYIPMRHFYFKDYADMEKKALEGMRQACDYKIDTLINKLGLTLCSDDISTL